VLLSALYTQINNKNNNIIIIIIIKAARRMSEDLYVLPQNCLDTQSIIL